MTAEQINSRVNNLSNAIYRCMATCQVFRHMDLDSVNLAARCATAAH